MEEVFDKTDMTKQRSVEPASICANLSEEMHKPATFWGTHEHHTSIEDEEIDPRSSLTRKSSTNLSQYRPNSTISNDVLPPTNHLEILRKSTVSSECSLRRSSSYPVDTGRELIDKIIGGSQAVIPRGFSSNDEESITVLEESMVRLLELKDYEPKIFYFIANQLYRRSRSTMVCPLCQHRKNPRPTKHTDTEHPQSHIFPNGLFEVYKDIHCAESDLGFIYDDYSGGFKPAKSLTFSLLCHTCESAASDEEHFLKHLYIQIMGAESNQRLRMESKQAEMLKHILAVILFRGMLVGINFFEEMHNEYFENLMETFFKLREFCHTFQKDPQNYKQSPISEQLHVFLLPNTHYNLNNMDPTYILDFQLRNPQFTSVIKQKGSNKAYLYTKFDCFHCVLPVDNSYGHFLKKSSCFIPDDEQHYSLPRETKGIHLFPSLLFNYNLQKIEHLIQLSNSLEKSCKCLIQNLAGIAFPRHTIEPTQDSESSTHNVVIFNKTEEDQALKQNFCEHAKEQSPIAGRQGPQINIIKELEKSKRALEQKNSNLDRKVTQSQKSKKKFIGDLHAKDIHIKELKKEIDDLEKKKNKEIEDLKKEIERLRSYSELNNQLFLETNGETIELYKPVKEVGSEQ